MCFCVLWSVTVINLPRRLLTSGTAAVAVAGAWLLAVEDAGLGPYTRAHVEAVSVASHLWEPSNETTPPVAPRRNQTDRDRAPARR